VALHLPAVRVPAVHVVRDCAYRRERRRGAKRQDSSQDCLLHWFSFFKFKV
jgi:hypothetical protein